MLYMKTRAFEKIKRKIEKIYPQVEVSVKDDCILLCGELNTWEDVITAGKMAVSKYFLGVLNDITLAGYAPKPMRMPDLSDNSLDNSHPDVLIIGGGVVGCAVARELSRYKLAILLVEKEDDVALAQSGRNDGCIHVGADLHYGTKKVEYLARSNPQFEKLSQQLGFEFERCGQYIVFDKWLYLLGASYLKNHCRKNKITNAKFMTRGALLRKFPTLNKKTKFGFCFDTGGIVCPYGMTIAYAENALNNGAQISLNTAVTSMQVENGEIISVGTNRGTIYPKVVVNAAGVFSDVVAQMANDRFFTIHPRKGLNCILDKKSLQRIPSASISTYGENKSKKKLHTKGGGIVRTVDGNILVGPNAEEIPDREDTYTSQQSVRAVIERQKRTAPQMNYGDIITYFSGVRACTYEEDFAIYKGRNTKNVVHAGGIQSPGLSAAPAIAEDVSAYCVEILTRQGLEVAQNKDFNPIRTPRQKVNALPEAERINLIKQFPDYGEIVCRCEQISKGEVLDVLANPLGVCSADGLKRRVRTGMGRCQGGFCQPIIAKLIAEHQKIPLEQVKKRGDKSILLSNNKE